MNPDKLFDYLDGKLSPADRDELENKLIDDPQLQRQFAIAREIHRSGRASREVQATVDDTAVAERGARLGRRIATAVAALILLNVLGGLAAITYLNKKPARPRVAPPAVDESNGVRHQMEDSLRAVGAAALPLPSLVDDEISLAAPKPEWANLTTAITDAAVACGGSAVAEPPSETSVIVTAHLPRDRYTEFRQKLLGTGSAPQPRASLSANDRSAFETVQIRIAEAAR